MCSRLLKNRGPGHKKTVIERISGGIEHAVLSAYGSSLNFFLRFRFISAVIWLGCLVATIYLFMIVPKAFLPKGDSSFLFGFMIAQEGSSPAHMHDLQVQAERVLQSDPNVQLTFTLTGFSGFLAGNQGILLAFLNDPSLRAPIEAEGGKLTGMLGAAVPGVLGFMQAQPVLSISTGLSKTTGDFQYVLSGIDPQQVYDASNQLLAKLRTYPGVFQPNSDLYNHTPNLQIDILRDQASSYGVSATRIQNLLSSAYAQNYVYLIKKPDDQYQVILEMADQDRSEPQDLSKLYIRSDDGSRVVPLNAVAKWHTVLGTQSVNHFNQFSSVTLSFNVTPGYPLGTVTDFVDKTAKETLPASIRGEFQGDALTFQNTIRNLTILMFVAVFVMYVILGILYESYLHPITVLSSLPVALVGGLATLVLFHAEASLYAFIGMFMLMGIVKKNGIMIVDFAIQRIARGQNARQAIHDASMDRFRPIIMTTLAAVMGAVPIALGFGSDGAGRRPLGLVIVGGLIVSQFITLYVTPVIYLYLEDFQEHVLDRTSFFRSSRIHPEEQRRLDRELAEADELAAVGGNGNGH
jgi:HAE1 family hydrophobic/amphiphilic exporter-1